MNNRAIDFDIHKKSFADLRLDMDELRTDPQKPSPPATSPPGC
jgi:hypothetical protein